MSERILSVLVEDKPGVLARISSTISRRGFNINSLSVGPTNIDGRSKMTIVTELESVEQVKKQLNKLINVIKIVELDPNNTIESEVMLMKVSINKDSQTSVIEKANLSGAKSVDVGQDYAVFELTGTSKELKKFENLMKPFGIIEMIRGGRIAIQSNL
ncbi:acetolactate synthase small subunit [Acidimicrobiia bacterium]|nr:acetolactate synthase small subunit [Acidimicrobiia bacterium]